MHQKGEGSMKKTSEKNGMIRQVLKGVLCGVAVIAVLVLLAGMMIAKGILPERMTQAAAGAATAAGGLVSGLVIVKQSTSAKAIKVMCGAIGLMLLLALIHAVCFSAAAYRLLPAALTIPVSALLAIGVELLPRRKRRYR